SSAALLRSTAACAACRFASSAFSLACSCARWSSSRRFFSSAFLSLLLIGGVPGRGEGPSPSRIGLRAPRPNTGRRAGPLGLRDGATLAACGRGCAFGAGAGSALAPGVVVVLVPVPAGDDGPKAGGGGGTVSLAGGKNGSGSLGRFGVTPDELFGRISGVIIT